MDCDHLDVRLTSEDVGLAHMMSVAHWFTCYVCNLRAVIVEQGDVVST